MLRGYAIYSFEYLDRDVTFKIVNSITTNFYGCKMPYISVKLWCCVIFTC